MLICPLCVVRSITYAVVNLIKKDRNFALTQPDFYSTMTASSHFRAIFRKIVVVSLGHRTETKQFRDEAFAIYNIGNNMCCVRTKPGSDQSICRIAPNH